VRKRVLSVAVALSLVSGAAKAWAVEREHALSVGVGGSILDVSSKGSADVGGGAAVAYSYGLSDALNFMAEASWSLVALKETARNAPEMATTLNVGVGYVFDVVRWVPYAGLLVGSAALNGGGINGVKFVPEAALALGFDYRFDRTWSAGIALRQYMFTDPGTYPSYSQAFARVEYIWGW
jgi:hypothetical protein